MVEKNSFANDFITKAIRGRSLLSELTFATEEGDSADGLQPSETHNSRQTILFMIN